MQSTVSKTSRFLNESRALLSLSLPIIITQLATNGMNFVDTSMAGQASARDLAAIAVGYQSLDTCKPAIARYFNDADTGNGSSSWCW